MDAESRSLQDQLAAAQKKIQELEEWNRSLEDDNLRMRLEFDALARRGKPGRPKKAPEPGERVQLSLRVTPAVKTKLDEKGAETGRSQSQEAEFRIEQSFISENLVAEALALALGSRTSAAFLLVLGLVMIQAGDDALATLQRVDKTPDTPELRQRADEIALGIALDAAHIVLEGIRPERSMQGIPLTYGLSAANTVLGRLRVGANPFFDKSFLAALAKDGGKAPWINAETQALLEGMAKDIRMMDPADLTFHLRSLFIRTNSEPEQGRGAGHGKGEHHKTGT